MKKIIYAILPAVMLASACKKDLTSINVNPKSPTTVPAAAEFTQAEHTFVNTVTSSNVNLNTFRLIVQHWNETTYTDESNYNLSTSRSITDGMWNAWYRDVLENLEQAKTLGTAQSTNPAATKVDNAEADILEVYAYYYLVTTYGNIPYTKALNPSNLFPSYDDAATVYNSLLTRLDADIAALAGGTGSLGAADVIYGGSAAKWTKFANTLKLKMGITIADADNAKAKSVIESAVAAGVFTSNSDNAFFGYLSAPPNTNPVWVDLVQSGRLDFIGASTLVNQLKSNSDPRLPLFFTTDNKGGYSGQTPGSSASYANFSAPSTTLTAPNFRGVLMDYAETEFALAEAAARGYNVGGTAESHYNAGITANILDWGGSATAAATYLAQPSVAYTTAVSPTATYKQKIGLQKWIAYYNRGYDAWIAQRLLDYPYMVPPTKALSGYPVRFTYPVNEGNVNGANVKAAGQAIGGDLVTTRLWFDKADQVKP
ncbi:SusD/RagB family nutrient-binding outer membrane lipoprotein [Mucilaginibacter sp. KACC 22063]|uniref:SusD/RagB family nutrient-binding outer membrane lipoprotein n=1 Tax=Mucilaginibacter sp. KACC 22063 TaxID=3025666 RepID=UPI002366339E|nr:SusD/RagB family nutrient-binding outer membrane lipoprotein [Mucilaginibacter sp. KACC 22063]WDF54492.1 SusD/RagB family nutrient-binding outer membrane lipoprotein [Mucilaginibacter sp. KACC 22063]